MPIVTIQDRDTGKRVNMNLDPRQTAQATIENVASYLEKVPGVYYLVYGTSVLGGNMLIGQSGLRNGDWLELVRFG